MVVVVMMMKHILKIYKWGGGGGGGGGGHNLEKDPLSERRRQEFCAGDRGHPSPKILKIWRLQNCYLVRFVGQFK
jgi:hypothetical protein